MTLRKTFVAIGIGGGLWAAPAHAEPPAADAVLQQLVEQALAQNPRLAASRQVAVAAETTPIQASSRPGPTVGVSYQNDGWSPSLGREPMTLLGVSGGQDFPYPGKLDLRRQVAAAEAGLAGLDVDRVRLDLVASVKEAYHGLALARGLAALAQEHRELWQEVQETARARYASALGSQQEMLRAQVEATRLHALHAQHHAEARARLAQLNTLLARPADTPVDTAPLLAPLADTRSPVEIVAWAEATSPELKAAALAVERDERALALANREFKPDFNVQGGLMYRGDLPPMWQASVSLMFPSRSRAKATVSEAEARLAGSRARQDDVRLRLRGAVEQRLAMLEAVGQIETTYRDGLLPQGELGVQSANATYAANQGPQAAVLEAAAALLDDRIDYLRLLSAHAIERARLEAASLESPVGIDSLLMHGRSTTPGGGMGPAAPGSPRSTMATTAPSASGQEMR
jgi:outer membrane protein TolC